MKKMWLTLFVATFVLWYFLNQKKEAIVADVALDEDQQEEVITEITKPKSRIINKKNLKQLDKIAEVINEKNIKISDDTKDQIKKEREIYDQKKTLSNLTEMLEKSFYDSQNTVDDIKSIQNKITKLKQKLNLQVTNTEKWDPRLIYYLMIQENYNYNELNSIRKLEDNGISKDELAYIKEVTQEKTFQERIKDFKLDSDPSRKVAAYKPKNRDRDEFIENDYDSSPTLEDKLIEMNYSVEEIQEMQKGFSY